MDHLDKLEANSVYLLREAVANFDRICMPWSMGKDSNVLIWLARKAFGGKVPFQLLHIDTTYEFDEMYEFRDWASKWHNLDLVLRKNEEALKRGVSYETHDALTVTSELKSVPLKAAIAEHNWQALITGVRRDEDPTRAKERYFSPRNADSEWDYRDQPPEFWGQFTTRLKPGEHIRVQPLLDWTELDIWLYIRRENIPVPSLYFAKEGKRYRSMGCKPVTHAVPSTAATIDDIIEELRHTKTSERAGRAAQDNASRNAMQHLRAKGFF